MDVLAGMDIVGAEALIQETVQLATETMQYLKGGQWLSTIDCDHILIFRNYLDAG